MRNPVNANDVEPRWVPLAALAPRFAANVAALDGRDPDLAGRLRSLAPATTYFVAAEATAVRIGTRDVAGGRVRPRPHTFTPARATEAARGLFPTGACTEPALVAGEDVGWLWDALYRLPCRAAWPVGFRPPLYFVLPDPERLWVMLHVHDWRDLLADGRCRLFAGPDAVARLGRALSLDWTYRTPLRWVTIDDAVWPPGVTLETLVGQAAADQAAAYERAGAYATPAEAAAVAGRLAAGRPLRVLGITSRFSSFIRHSMRGLARRLRRPGPPDPIADRAERPRGGQTRSSQPAACDAFRPDLVVAIGHYRKTILGIPDLVPVVMWVQDIVPHVFRPEAGAAQGPLDFLRRVRQGPTGVQARLPGRPFSSPRRWA